MSAMEKDCDLYILNVMLFVQKNVKNSTNNYLSLSVTFFSSVFC